MDLFLIRITTVTTPSTLGIAKNFLNQIKGIYKNTHNSIAPNGEMMKAFPLKSGTG